jgi:hypothetical protein
MRIHGGERLWLAVSDPRLDDWRILLHVLALPRERVPDRTFHIISAV